MVVMWVESLTKVQVRGNHIGRTLCNYNYSFMALNHCGGAHSACHAFVILPRKLESAIAYRAHKSVEQDWGMIRFVETPPNCRA